MTGGGGGSGWSTLSHGKTRTKPSSTRVVNEEMFNSLAQQESDDENSVGASPMGDDDNGMNQMLTTSTRGNSDFDSDDPNAEVEIVDVKMRPQTQQNMRGMRPPTTTSSGGYSSSESQKSTPLRSGSRPMPRGRPSSSHETAPQPQRQPPSPFDDDEDSNMMNSPQSGPAESEGDEIEMSMPRGRGASSSHSSRPSGNSKYRGKASSSGGWSSGPPKTITYITHGWGGPPSSGGWGGWESSEPSSHGWPASFDEDDYWPIGGGSKGWSSGNGGWSSSSSGSGSGWTPGPPPSTGGGTDETDPEEEMPPQPTEGPVEMVGMVGSTEEGEDRRPPSTGRRPMSSSGRRPVSNKPRPSSAPPASAAAPVSPSRRPSGGNSARPTSSVPIRGAMMPPAQKSRPQQMIRQKLPRTNEPQPEYLDVVAEVMPGSPRPQYGVPSSSGSGSGGLGSSSSSSSSGQQLMLGGQVISSQDGLLDEELIRTVQQIIQQFDKN